MTVRKIVVWDLPVRLFHWAVVALICALYISARQGRMDLHAACGKLILTLLVFRLCWGLAGSQTARFRSFFRGPITVWRYLRGRVAGPSYGHNYLGGWSIILMLAVLAGQGISGLYSRDDVLFEGPAASFIDEDLSNRITHWHRWDFYYVLLPLIALHIGAILYYRLVKKRDLIMPMITGKTRLIGADDDGPVRAKAWRAAACALLAGAFWWWLNRM